VIQRWMHFAVANPARQVFYTVLEREEKYKAKNLIDVVIYRGSDALYGWVFDTLQTLGLKLGSIALVAAPVSAVWLILSVALGRAQERRAKLMDAGAVPKSEMTKLTRREFAILPVWAAAPTTAFAQPSTPLITRAIPAELQPSARTGVTVLSARPLMALSRSAPVLDLDQCYQPDKGHDACTKSGV
jgi:hypothetical protein